MARRLHASASAFRPERTRGQASCRECGALAPGIAEPPPQRHGFATRLGGLLLPVEQRAFFGQRAEEVGAVFGAVGTGVPQGAGELVGSLPVCAHHACPLRRRRRMRPHGGCVPGPFGMVREEARLGGSHGGQRFQDPPVQGGPARRGDRFEDRLAGELVAQDEVFAFGPQEPRSMHASAWSAASPTTLRRSRASTRGPITAAASSKARPESPRGAPRAGGRCRGPRAEHARHYPMREAPRSRKGCRRSAGARDPRRSFPSG